MRLTIVGVTHPYKGGVPLHTNELARRLAEDGHDVDIIGWSYEDPEFVDRTLPPEAEPFPRITKLLNRSPLSWLRVTRRLRSSEGVVFTIVTAAECVPYQLITRAVRWGRGTGPKVVVLCHNVLDPEHADIDVRLVSGLMKVADGVLVHTEAEAVRARELGANPVEVSPMPPHLPDLAPEHQETAAGKRLLFFGMVRPYKGLDVLLRAMALLPEARLLVAGQFLFEEADKTEKLIAELGIADRVEVDARFIPAEDVPALFANADAVVLPYRAGTASQLVWMAHEHGVPVVATRMSSFTQQVRDGVDGLLCEADDPQALADTLKHFYEPGVADRLRAGVRPVDRAPVWARYVEALRRLFA